MINMPVLESAIITEELHRSMREKLRECFPNLLDCSHEDYLSLWKYLSNIPERFYSQNAYKSVLGFLEEMKEKEKQKVLVHILNQPEWIPNIAFKSLSEINSLDFHDLLLPSNEYELMQFCENSIHPAYLRLLEAAFSCFIYPIAAYERILRNKNLDGLDLFNRVVEVKRTRHAFLADVYDNTIRNSIAHGSIIYRQLETTYVDRNNSVVLATRDIINKFDSLTDICNGLSIGYRIFYFTNLGFCEKHGLSIPLPIMVEELQATTESPGWRINGCIESTVSADESQLIVFSDNSFLDPMKLNYHVLRSAIHCEKFAPGYKHYFFSLNSKHSLLGWAGFNGDELQRLRNDGTSEIGDYTNVFDGRGIAFNPKPKIPRLFLRASTLFSSFKVNTPVIIQRIRDQLYPVSINPRDTMIHRNGLHAVVRSSIVMKTDRNELGKGIIRIESKSILKKAIRRARRRARYSDVSKYLPVGYVRILIFSEDHRKRKLRNPGLIPELICTIQRQRLKRIVSPDIMGGEPECINGIRIVWNKSASDLRGE